MTFHFDKYQATGNDFIMIDDRDGRFPAREPDLIRAMCDRHFGIGADGLMLLGREPGYDFRMTYFNADGHEGTMCGNGGRCAILFARSLGMVTHPTIRFMAIDGDHEGVLAETVRIRMKDVREIREMEGRFFVDTGSPHLVIPYHDLSQLDVVTLGRNLRNDAAFLPGGTNVNFIIPGDKDITIRTYERGVENETLSCGTGSVAAVIAIAYQRQLDRGRFLVQAPGGRLHVSFARDPNGSYRDIWLEGPARKVFSGTYTINPST